MDKSLIYMTGNGRIAGVYSNGELVQGFGPPYSSPSLFLSEFSQRYDALAPTHEPFSPIWHTKLCLDGKIAGSVTDFAPPEIPVLIRKISGELSLTLRQYKEGLLEYAHALNESAVLIKSKNGNAIYNDYPLTFPQYFIIFVRNGASLRLKGLDIEISAKTAGEIYIIGGTDYPDTCLNFKKVQDLSYEELFESTKSHWKHIFDGIPVYAELKSKELYLKDQLLSAVEDTVLAILTQQGEEGGVLAGYNYHLGYVRDQFGVCQCLLRLKMFDRAKKILSFYTDVFNRFGKILNAQAMGVPGIFHFAENDKVEITGYLLLQFFRYAEASGDTAFLWENIDFLKWLFLQQREELCDNTLPFNGDETYIAGGLLPRDVIADASAEATLLFLYSGELLADLLSKSGENTCEMTALLTDVRANFAAHFIKNGVYYINDPLRKAPLPEFRYGVCMNSNEAHFSFGWTRLTEGERYVCPLCYKNGDTRPRTREQYALPSALLIPGYLKMPMDEINESARAHVKRLVEQLLTTGHAYSKEKEKLNVGYDYGLLLANLIYFDLDGKTAVYEKILSLRDGAGVWAEYYAEDKPFNTRYRPWESAINLDASLEYALSR